jgi:hypothetical protein
MPNKPECSSNNLYRDDESGREGKEKKKNGKNQSISLLISILGIEAHPHSLSFSAKLSEREKGCR